ncbi:Uncharacterised protein [Cronobacter sakazakii]|nr:Uncharacterised protein [Cronobacter sakazakii]
MEVKCQQNHSKNAVAISRRWAATGPPTELSLIKSLAGSVHPKIIARQLNRSYESIRQMAKR